MFRTDAFFPNILHNCCLVCVCVCCGTEELTRGLMHAKYKLLPLSHIL